MAGDDPTAGTTRASGLLGSIKTLVATLVDVAHTRLQLLANEIEEEKLRLAQLLMFGVLTVLFFILGIIFLTLLVIVLFWDSDRILVIGCFAGAYLVLGIVCGGMTLKRASARSTLFAASLRELAKDRERLSL